MYEANPHSHYDRYRSPANRGYGINPGTVALAKNLRRYKVQGRKRTVREIAGELALAGFVTGTGTPYAAAAVAKMIEA
jgi:hypothetical protein